MNTMRKNKIENYMRFYKRKKLDERFYGYVYTKNDNLVAITNGYSLLYLSDDFKGIKENEKLGNGLINSVLDKIMNLKESNYTEISYEEIKDYKFENDTMGFDITLVYKNVSILGSDKKCKFYVVDTNDYSKKALVIISDNNEYSYILPYKIY
jgi:hypothetical protein